MRHFTTLQLLLLAATSVASSTAMAQTWTDFQVGGTTRKALVYVPNGINHPPLLLSFHGMGIGAAWNQGGMMKFEPIADRDKFIVVYPEADQNLRWDLGGTHDTDFVLKIIEDMTAQYGIDTNRVYASGFSMGGMFSYTLACKLPTVFAAIAPGDGYPLGGESGCSTERSVPIFHMHGTADDFVGYSGIHNFLNSKIAQYGCPTTAVTTKPYPVGKADSKSFKEYWGPCDNGNGKTSEIILVSVAGMIHDWATAGKANANTDPEFAGKPFDIDGSEEAWAFLKQHSLDSSVPGGGGAGGAAGAAGEGGAGGSSCPGDASHAYQGVAAAVPGTLQAEDFDVSGYQDSSSGNEGGAYRTDTDVDIKSFGAGYAVGWMTAGEWLEYTVNVSTAGTYRATFSVGAVDADRTFELSRCGAPVGTLAVPQVGAWGELGTVSTELSLDAGLQVLRITVGAKDYLDFDSVALELLTPGGGAAGGAGAGSAGMGSSGTAGMGSGGTAGMGTSGAAGTGLGGSAGAAGGSAAGGPGSSASADSGCGCRASGVTGTGWIPAVGVLLGLGALRRRRPRG